MAENTSLEVRDIEKRELNASFNSYVENRNELLVTVPELIDWNMFQRRCVPELVEVLQMQHRRLKKRGVTIRTRQRELFKRDNIGEEFIAQTERLWYDGPYSIYVLRKKEKRFREYCRENREPAGFTDKGWFTYYFRQEPGEGKKISSEYIESTRLGSYGRESEYSLEQNLKQERVNLWTLMFLFWILTSVVSFVSYFIISGFLSVTFPGISEEMMLGVSLINAGCLDVVLRVRLLMMYLRYRLRVKSHKVLESIRQQWPEFCIEKFIAMTDSRLKRIFYADSMADIGNFVSCDLTEFLKKYANVVDCETLDFRFVGMSQDENYEYIDVRQKVLLTGDLGYRMKRKKRTVKIRFMRSKDSIMYTDFYRDWYVGEVDV